MSFQISTSSAVKLGETGKRRKRERNTESLLSPHLLSSAVGPWPYTAARWGGSMRIYCWNSLSHESVHKALPK